MPTVTHSWLETAAEGSCIITDLQAFEMDVGRCILKTWARVHQELMSAARFQPTKTSESVTIKNEKNLKNVLSRELTHLSSHQKN